jgi:hypothetical protein
VGFAAATGSAPATGLAAVTGLFTGRNALPHRTRWLEHAASKIATPTKQMYFMSLPWLSNE